MSGIDLSFVSGKEKFNYRVCAVIISEGKLLAMHDERSLKCTPCQGHFNSEGWKNLRPHDMILLYHPRRIVQR